MWRYSNFKTDLLKTNLQTKFSVKCSALGPKVTTKSMFVINFNFDWITLAVKQISGITKKLIWVIKEQNMQTFILRPIFALYLCRFMFRNEHRWNMIYFISSPSTWSKVSSTKKKQIVNILGQKLIWREVCSTNSLPSTVLY